MIRMAVLLAASLVFVTPAQTADTPKEGPLALERKLHGEWRGGPCQGDWTFRADGTFEVQHYTPGNNKLSGTWQVRWNALPPTLVRICKTSDNADRFPVGKTWEVKLIQLDDEALVYQYLDQYPAGQKVRCTRVSRSVPAQGNTQEEELAALQGTWIPVQYEEGGKKVQGEFHCKHIIKGDKVTVLVNGETTAEGKVIVDPTKYPKHLDFQFASGRTDLIIYVRAGDYIIYCGNREGKTRPSEFASGTATGGEYLLAWKIEK